jgi:CDP-6-deoxy-D-xylo-4-hexulose-3-dehydrase
MIDASLDAWLTTGRFNDAFEAAGQAVGVAHLLTVNSGSSANLVAFSALTSPSWAARDPAGRRGDRRRRRLPDHRQPDHPERRVPVFVDVELAPTTST